MRRANPDELAVRAVPAITVHLTESELGRWFPIAFDDIADPLAVPEPSKGALVQLEGGSYVVVYFGRESEQLVLEVPENVRDIAAVVDEFFKEVPLPVSRVLWHRDDIGLPAGVADSSDNSSASPVKRSAQRVSLPKSRK